MADDSYFTSFSSEELEGGHTISRQPFLGVADFLKRNGFSRFADAFRKNNITTREDFQAIRFGSLAQLGISGFADQKQLMNLISQEQRLMFREMQEEVERQRLSTPEKRPGTAPFLLGTARFGGVATDGDEDFHYDGRPRTAGVMSRTWSGPARSPSPASTAWMAKGMTMRMQPSQRRLEAPNVTTSKAQRLVKQDRFMSLSMKSLRKMQQQGGELKRERLQKLRSQKIDLNLHRKDANVDMDADTGPEEEAVNGSGKNKKKGASKKGGAPSSKAARDAKLAYKRHLLRVDLQNISISMEARQSRLDEYCETVCERFPSVAREAAELRRKHWKPPRKNLLKKKVIKKLIKRAPLKLPPKSKVVLTPHTVSKDGSGINGVYLQLQEVKMACENQKKMHEKNAKASRDDKKKVHHFMDEYHASVANFSPPPKTRPKTGANLNHVYHHHYNKGG